MEFLVCIVMVSSIWLGYTSIHGYTNAENWLLSMHIKIKVSIRNIVINILQTLFYILLPCYYPIVELLVLTQVIFNRGTLSGHYIRCCILSLYNGSGFGGGSAWNTAFWHAAIYMGRKQEEIRE